MTYIEPKSNRITVHFKGSLRGNVKCRLEEICFEMLFQCCKDLSSMSGTVSRIPVSWCTDTESTRDELFDNTPSPQNKMSGITGTCLW